MFGSTTGMPRLPVFRVNYPFFNSSTDIPFGRTFLPVFWRYWQTFLLVDLIHLSLYIISWIFPSIVCVLWMLFKEIYKKVMLLSYCSTYA